jgi:Ca2+-binding RTX toxin-like protein
VFDSTLGLSNIDTITDFTSGIDKIRLDDDIFKALGVVGTTAGVSLKVESFQLGASALDAMDRILYDQSTGSLFYDADGTGTANNAVKFAILTGMPTLLVTDFFVIA